MTRTESIFVAGHRGLAGSAILRELQAEGYTQLLTRTRAELDLLDGPAVRQYFAETRPKIVVVAAAKVGGIKANNDYPVEFLLENLRIQNHLIEAAAEYGTRKLLFLGNRFRALPDGDSPLGCRQICTEHCTSQSCPDGTYYMIDFAETRVTDTACRT